MPEPPTPAYVQPPPHPAEGRVRLLFGSSPLDGVLVVSARGQWMLPLLPAAQIPLSRETARVVCRSMGAGLREAAWQPTDPFAYPWPELEGMPLESLSCAGGEASLTGCSMLPAPTPALDATPVAVACVQAGEEDKQNDMVGEKGTG
ncbi:hypothetical protein GPECTOR_1g155 [Gonium pectorale]|uniref:SRCR domain-containing protein n=1 Tax=Gonium pectorale TaxID=33097 RepID=A0A150H3P3_GONPE|nr:hypothetical protein GPECTOR_1g155 [Gonium pectorale]|eukprot:KXZ56180.1 hypothetical protein GPECTOR_1g155 [Gonium pectorale]